MPRASDEIQKKVAAFNDARKFTRNPDSAYSPIRLQIDLEDPTEAASGLTAEFAAQPPPGTQYAGAELLHDEARNLYQLHAWFVTPLTEEQRDLRDVLTHTQDRDFPSYKGFRDFLIEVLPTRVWNRVKLILDRWGLTEMQWQQARVAAGKTPGVQPHVLLREALQKGGKPVFFGDSAERVRRALDVDKPAPPTQ